MNKNEILDVGCGFFKMRHARVGAVGIDLHKGMCDIVADAHYLPIREGAFKMVYASHVLEHCKHPYQVLEEFKRVSNRKVVIKVPNVGIWDINPPDHIYSWSKHSFKHLLEQHFNNVTVYSGMRSLDVIGVHPFLHKYPVIRKTFAIIHTIVTFVLLHMTKNELVGIGETTKAKT